MAVPKRKTTRSRRGNRRAHHALTTPTLSVDPLTQETHLRHHITESFHYRGRPVLAKIRLKLEEKMARKAERRGEAPSA